MVKYFLAIVLITVARHLGVMQLRWQQKRKEGKPGALSPPFPFPPFSVLLKGSIILIITLLFTLNQTQI